MKTAVITFPGSNCDYDCYKAVQIAGGDVEFRWHRDSILEGVDAVVLPGGFSYGDYLRAGAIARFSPIMDAVKAFAEEGGLVLGICNGFQILCEAGLLPGALIRNHTLRFHSFEQHLRVENAGTIFSSDYEEGQVLHMPVAHAEGNYFADPDTLARLEEERRVVFRYVDREGRATEEANPNGSVDAIAGIVNDAGNILGMMPHPDRAMEEVLGSTDGRGVFTSMLRHGAPVEAI